MLSEFMWRNTIGTITVHLAFRKSRKPTRSKGGIWYQKGNFSYVVRYGKTSARRKKPAMDAGFFFYFIWPMKPEILFRGFRLWLRRRPTQNRLPGRASFIQTSQGRIDRRVLKALRHACFGPQRQGAHGLDEAI